MKRPMRLLVVDDEKIEREAVRFFASSFDPPFDAVAEASNGVEAVQRALEFRPDIIVMDIRMPGKSGVEAAAEIRARDPRVGIVFLTAFGELDYARAAIKVRADDFLVKPVSGEAFSEALRRAVSSLEEAGALGAHASGAGSLGARDAEAALREAIRKGDPDEAERAAARLFAQAVRADTGIQEARRSARLMVAVVERALSEEFGRTLAAGAEALDRLGEARDRDEAKACALAAARGLAGEVAALKSDPHRQIVDAALAYIAKRLAAPITLEETSAAVGMSRFHFSRVFHAATGATFSEYLGAERIKKAKELLSDPSLPMKRICELAGFSDAAYFSSAFKRREGMSPSEYRALAKRTPGREPLLRQRGGEA